MARVCAECREPVTPVNLCVCDLDDDPDDPDGGEDEAA